LHELGIAEEILGIVLAEAERNQAKKVSAIRLRVGSSGPSSRSS